MRRCPTPEPYMLRLGSAPAENFVRFPLRAFSPPLYVFPCVFNFLRFGSEPVLHSLRESRSPSSLDNPSLTHSHCRAGRAAPSTAKAPCTVLQGLRVVRIDDRVFKDAAGGSRTSSLTPPAAAEQVVRHQGCTRGPPSHVGSYLSGSQVVNFQPNRSCMCHVGSCLQGPRAGKRVYRERGELLDVP